MVRTKWNLPERRGKLDIYPQIDKGAYPSITIIGDPHGLHYLSELLTILADRDQESNDDLPQGEREHIHLYREYQLGGHSCEVEVCRADAKGTGELPDFMK